MNDFIIQIITILASVVAILFVFVPHEFAHAYAAYKNGDYTAQLEGRLTLNPVKHFDPIGFLLCAFAGFGWAKPVPINPNNFRKFKKGLIITALAGVITNYIIAFICYPIALALEKYVLVLTDNTALSYLLLFVWAIPYMIYTISLSIFVFNLLPLYPLDGFRIVEACTSPFNKVRQFLQRYGQYILIGLIVECFICNMIRTYTGVDGIKYINILGFYVLELATKGIGAPIYGLWDFIFSLF